MLLILTPVCTVHSSQLHVSNFPKLCIYKKKMQSGEVAVAMQPSLPNLDSLPQLRFLSVPSHGTVPRGIQDLLIKRTLYIEMNTP